MEQRAKLHDRLTKQKLKARNPCALSLGFNEDIGTCNPPELYQEEYAKGPICLRTFPLYHVRRPKEIVTTGQLLLSSFKCRASPEGRALYNEAPLPD